jgi:diguanylate cyclase (GGDEF)-like protein
MEKILIVDDNMLSLKTLEDILKDEYHVISSRNGRDAVKIAKEHSPAIILLDVVMPVVDGFQVLAALKKIPETRSIPIIFLTSLNDPDHEEIGLMLGAVDYVHKPFSPGVIKARVKNQIDLFLMRKTIESIALTDALTNIDNRRSLDSRAEVEWCRARREQTLLSIAFVDIDDFKSYNDHYGHLEGDEILKIVAKKIIESFSRKTDFAARYGGEEFVVLLPNTSIEGGEMMLQKVRASIEALAIPHVRSVTAPVVTVSAGGASIIPPKKGYSLKNLMDMADKMLYKAKGEGKNRVVWNKEPLP